MVDDMVMRSVYFRPAEDAQLRQLAHDLNVTKSDLIRAAASLKLEEWLESDDRERILEDVERGRRDEDAVRSGRRGRRQLKVPTAQQTNKTAGVVGGAAASGQPRASGKTSAQSTARAGVVHADASHDPVI